MGVAAAQVFTNPFFPHEVRVSHENEIEDVVLIFFSYRAALSDACCVGVYTVPIISMCLLVSSLM